MAVLMTTLALAVPVSAIVTSSAEAADYPLPTREALTEYSAQWHAVRDEQGVRAPGRNIRRMGIRTPDGQIRAASASEVADSTRQLRALRQPLLKAGPPAQPPADVQTPHAGPLLEAIAACESGGSPTAVSASGQYRGKYQFDQQTWAAVGGSGDPAAAPEAEQDMRAAALYARRGATPWPICGR